MQQSPSSWAVAALFPGFGIAWFVFARCGRGSSGERQEMERKEMLRALLVEEGANARKELRENIDASTGRLLDRIESIRKSGDEKVDRIRETVDENLKKSMTSSFEHLGLFFPPVLPPIGSLRFRFQAVLCTSFCFCASSVSCPHTHTSSQNGWRRAIC